MIVGKLGEKVGRGRKELFNAIHTNNQKLNDSLVMFRFANRIFMLLQAVIQEREYLWKFVEKLGKGK